MSTPIGFTIILLLVVMNGFFVAVEFAFVACDRNKIAALAKDGSWSAGKAAAALKQLSFHLSGAQLGITVTSLVLGFLAEPLVGGVLERFWGNVFTTSSAATIFVALAIATIFQMVVGELIPKSIAISEPEKVAQVLAPIAQVVNGALRPLILLFNGAANYVVRRFGLEPQEEFDESHSLQDLEYLIKSSGDSGTLDAEAQQLLTKTIKFGDKTAADALTPRVSIIAADVNDSVASLLEKVTATRYSKFPIIDGDIDTVKGVIAIGAIFSVSSQELEVTKVSSLMTEPLVIPESRELVDVLADFKEHETQMAIVLDEHGGTAGILTQEDVLEEIVGDIDDEYDEETVLTVGVQEGSYLLAGTLHPDQVFDACGFEMPEGPYETLAGFVLYSMGKIPYVHEYFQYNAWEFEVLEMDKQRVASLQLRQLDPPSVVVAQEEK